MLAFYKVVFIEMQFIVSFFAFQINHELNYEIRNMEKRINSEKNDQQSALKL